jgi:hypothetical protein
VLMGGHALSICKTAAAWKRHEGWRTGLEPATTGTTIRPITYAGLLHAGFKRFLHAWTAVG